MLPGGQLTSPGKAVAIAVVAFISALNYVGVRRAGNFQLAFTVLKIALIVIIAAIAFSSSGSWSHFTEQFSGATGGFAGFVAAVTAALWAYDGWSDLNMVAEEVKDPERNIPLALIAGFLVIAALYMIVNAAVQFALPAVAVATSASPMADAVRISALGAAAAIFVSVAMIISLITSLNGVAMSGSRMTFALSRDGNFISSLSRVHPRFHTPHIAIIVQAVLSLGFLFLGGNFRQLFTLSLFAEWLSYTAAAIALFVFRSASKTVPEAVPLWKFPIAPALFIVASAALLYYTFTSNLRYSGLGSLVILAGIPVYYGFSLRR
jgi:APA family basic amino acid/polyamine antiporter